MNKFAAPKRWVNASLFYIGCFGVVFQITAQLYSWWIGLGFFTDFWWTWPAPLICLLWGLLPSLQLQPEPHSQKPQSTLEV